MTDWQIGDYWTFEGRKRWEICRFLRGGMANVYVVMDHDVGLPLAAKTFQDEIFARDQRIADRFTREALAWIQMDVHQNVVQASTLNRIQGKPTLFLEYVSGGDLGKWIGTSRLMGNLSTVLRLS